MAVDRFMEADDRIVRTRTPWENLHKPTRLSLSRVVGGPGPTTDIDMGLSDLIWFDDTRNLLTMLQKGLDIGPVGKDHHSQPTHSRVLTVMD
ncbi:hypothetical protein F9C07_1066 [Aspergillus flavus]|uniref:Uncharacterized protein n=1 Tax=Aspergillus flavus (strain ATCC 200026 / FGSC A1120 / IAM 13836 / NRRL 3357 / JCM 12722 / SRRC 167) TaxID=332952 RepID=A0A7U2MQL6_ASPFN|nr:hypothetical protein F9C07_1066 [Aspergillus flavus]